MKNTLPTFRFLIALALLLVFGNAKIAAQNPYPTSGFTLPANKTIVITYEVDVNANVCPNGTLPANISNQSTVSGSNFPTVQTDDPEHAGTPSPTLTTVVALTLGDQVFLDDNRDGFFDINDDFPIENVVVNLYADNNPNGMLDVGDGPPVATTTTDVDGFYSFLVCPGNYIVEIAASNFLSGGALYDNGLMTALVSSPTTTAPDPDNNVDNDDNGDPVAGFGVASQAITMAYGTEPDDADMNTNNRLDFGFKTPTTVTINDVAMDEGTGGGPTAFDFTVTRSDNSEAFSLTVNTVAGTATSGSDFTAIVNGTVTFTAGGNLMQTVTVNVTHDNIVENNETFAVNLTGAPAGVIITDGTGDGSITNDDAAVVTLTSISATQNEGTGAGTTEFVFRATLNNPVQGGFTIAYTSDDGTTNPATTADGDYNNNDGTIAFTGTANEQHDIAVQVNKDNKVELNETFTVSLGAITLAPAGVTAAGSPQTGNILNDDAATVSIAADVSQSEATTPQAFSVTLSNPVDVNVTVNFNTATNTATADDYTGIVNQLVTFTAGTTTAQIVNVTVSNDNKVEADEIFDVSIGTLAASGRNVSLGTSARTGTIQNDDNAIVTISGPVAQNEGNSGTTNFVFDVNTSKPVQGGFSVAFTTNDGSATTADNDYNDNDNSVSFPDNSTTTQNITVQVNGDLNIEADETFTVLLGTITGPTPVQTAAISIGGTNPQTGTILNDEQDWGDAPTAAQSGFAGTYPTLNANNGARHAVALGGLRLGATIDAETDGQPNANATGDGADEDGVTLPTSFITGLNSTITVNVSAACKLDAWMDWNRDGDWNDMGEQIFTAENLVTGDNTLTVPVPVVPIGNSFARFRVSSAGGLAPTGAAADGEVEDYEIQILNRAISINDVDIAEGDAGTTTFNFTVSLNTPAGPGGVTFDIATQNNTATTANNDYVAKSLTGQTILEGESNHIFSVVVNGDEVVEDNETFFVNLTNVTGAGVADAQGQGTITNDDLATLTLSGGVAQNEGNAGPVVYTFTATLNKAVQGGFKVAYTTSDGTTNPATAGTDYTDTDGDLTFAGTIGEQQSWTVLVNGDNTVEFDETFEGALGSITMTSAVQAAAISKPGSPQTSTITNDDAATVSIDADVSQAENLTPQIFSITISNPVDVPVSVLFNTADGTAMAGDNDYTGIVNQSVTFPANTTTAQTVNVTIGNDNKVETNETYTVSIGTLSAAGRSVSFGSIFRSGTIVNDDAATVTLTPAGGVTQTEGNTFTTDFVFTATLNNPVQGGFMLAYTTSDGTASEGSDYQNNDGSLTFTGTMGEARNITVLVNGDLFVEVNETFIVTLGAISGAPAGVTTAGSPQIGVILNDEIDFGDAPDSYGTLLASDGARHFTSPNIRLGATIDGELDGQPGVLADGDDTDAEGDDDDGVTLPSALVLNTTADITINASIAGFVNAWVDFDLNGDFNGPDELVFNQQAVIAGANALSFAVPAGATVGSSYARFRFTQGAVAAVPTGQQTTGEVEDYQINIVNTQFSIDDPSVAEGDAGTRNLTFNISRTVNANACSVDYAITGGTATSGTDYQVFASGTANFIAGGAFSQPIIVTVNGDITVELDETVEMTLSNPVNASILDGTGIGEITNDDQGVITMTGAIVTEGDAGTVNATFDISLSNPSDANVSLGYTSNDVSATLADNDYQLTVGNHTFLPGETTKQVSVPVNGDCAIESDEQFLLVLGALGAAGRDVIFIGDNSTLSAGATITNDDALPEISCPANNSYDTDPGQCSATVTLPLPTLGSICGGSTLEFRHRTVDAGNNPTGPYSSYVPSANNTLAFPKGRHQVEWTITDGSGTSMCSYFIEIVDNELPTVTCPNPVTVTCSSQVPAVNLAAVTAMDNCPGVVKSHVGDATTNMTCANRKTVTRTYRATDASGNSTSCAQVITVFDNVAPNFSSVPANVTVQCNSVPAVGSPSASDGCGGVVSIAYDGQTVSDVLCTDKYTLTRKWTATDACGNTKTATQRIVVTDTQKPAFVSVPANVTVQCDDPIVLTPGTPTATDNCDTDVAITYNGQTRTNGTCLNRYTLTRRWTAADNCGNTLSVSQRITVVDNGKPTLSLPPDATIACNDPIPAVGTPTATDGCEGAVTIAYLGQTTANSQCPGTYQIKRVWRATDACGNSTAATQTIQVLDTGAPVFVTVPGPVTIECNTPLPPLVNPTASDACGGYVHITFLGQVPTGSGCAADYTVTRTWRAQDLCGNTATATQVITVQGNSYGEEGAENRVAEPTRRTTASRPTNLALQPNPTTDRFWLDLSDFAGESVTVSVVSDLGQLVWERKIPAVEDLKLSVSLREAGAAAGIYTVSVRSAHGMVATRVVLVE